MTGQPETLVIAEDGSAVEVARGDKGAALISFSPETVEISLSTTLPDGIYSDKVHSSTFNVNSGVITGHLAPHATYILYAE